MALNGTLPLALSDGYAFIRVEEKGYYVPLLEISLVSAGARERFSEVYLRGNLGEDCLTFVRCEDETLVKDISDCFRSACGN